MKRFITILYLSISMQTFATVRLVPAQYSTIQAALNAAKAGDTILVSSNTYNENIIWPQTHNLHLIAADIKDSSVFIDGSGAGRVIDIEGTGGTPLQAEIKGFTILNGLIDVPAHQGGKGAGIYGNNSVITLSNCVIKNNTIITSAAIQNSG